MPYNIPGGAFDVTVTMVYTDYNRHAEGSMTDTKIVSDNPNSIVCKTIHARSP